MPVVVAVHRSSTHSLAKLHQLAIRLTAGLGVEGDAHAGSTVKHRSRVAKDPTQPNLRQVHLIHAELLDELAAKGFKIAAGQMGENITTRGIDLLSLPTGAKLMIGQRAVIEITGLRNPCVQLEKIAKGLMEATLERGPSGNFIRKAGVMGIVVTGGDVAPGDGIAVSLPAQPHRSLAPV